MVTQLKNVMEHLVHYQSEDSRTLLGISSKASFYEGKTFYGS